MATQDKILDILSDKGDLTVHELSEMLEVSRQMVHRALNQLIDRNTVLKLGRSPKTFYRLNDRVANAPPTLNITQETIDFLDIHFLVITEIGEKIEGLKAIDYWCRRQKLPLEKTIREYVNTRKNYLSYYQPNGLIDGMFKLQNTQAFDQIGLDEVWYGDFYAIERFGKTRLGVLLHFAKQGQNRQLMKEIIELCIDQIRHLVTTKEISAVGYIPPTIKRELQLMKVLEKGFSLSLPHIKLVKVSGDIAVPQKALSKIEDRVRNANVSIMVQEKRQFDRVLLIDDAIGSGATINETAIKLKRSGIARSVIGLAITGSYKGFEVIQEV